MGCNLTSSWNDVDEVQLSERLTERQMEVIRSTWQLIAQDMDGAGMSIYTRLIQCERLKALFLRLVTQNADSSCQRQSVPHENVGNIETDNEGVDSKCHQRVDELMLKKHASVTMEAFGAAVECLDDSVFLSGVLVALGRIHANHRVRSRHLQRMWPPIRDGLREVLQDEFTEEVEYTWRAVFNYIISKMKEGIRLESRNAGDGNLYSPVGENTQF